MSGWDKDKSGDYVPKPMPKCLWAVLIAAAAGFFLLLVFAS